MLHGAHNLTGLGHHPQTDRTRDAEISQFHQPVGGHQYVDGSSVTVNQLGTVSDATWFINLTVSAGVSAPCSAMTLDNDLPGNVLHNHKRQLILLVVIVD